MLLSIPGAAGLLGLFPALAEYSEKQQEEVNEIQVERQGPKNSPFSDDRAVEIRRLRECHVFELLGIIGREPHKNEHADIAHNHAHRTAPDEKVHQGGNDNANEAHHKKPAKRRQIPLCGPAVNAASQERAGADKKGADNGCSGISKKYERKG